jgi:hypothetical protein
MSRGPSVPDVSWLEHEKSNKLEQLNSRRSQLADIEKRCDMLYKLTDQIDQNYRGIKKQLADSEAQAMTDERRAAERRTIDMRDLDQEMQRNRVQWNEAKAQYELITERIMFYEERAAAEETALNREILEAQYTRQLIIARYNEVQARVESIRKILRVSHPEADLSMEFPVEGTGGGSLRMPMDFKAKRQEKVRLERDCDRIYHELETYRQSG